MNRIFKDRHEAGKFLALQLEKYKAKPNTVVLGLPRGGVVVAYEVAKALQLPLDVFVVRKLGLPDHEELAIGAISVGGTCVLDKKMTRLAGLSQEDIDRVIQKEKKELERREKLYRDWPPIKLQGQIVLIVDDGLATGSTMHAAVMALRQYEVRKIVVAVPVGSSEACNFFKHEVDDVVCAMIPESFYAVGAWYHDFDQTSDGEVRTLLHTMRQQNENKHGHYPVSQPPV